MSAAAPPVPGVRALDLHRWGDSVRRRHGFPQAVHELLTHLIRVTKSPAQCGPSEAAWTCEDSVGQMAAETGYCKRQVQRAIAILRAFQLVHRVERPWKTWVLRLDVGALQRFAELAKAGGLNVETIKQTVELVAYGAKTAAKRAAEHAKAVARALERKAERVQAKLAEILAMGGGKAPPAREPARAPAGGPSPASPSAPSSPAASAEGVTHELAERIVRDALGETRSLAHAVRGSMAHRMWREAGRPSAEEWAEQWGIVADALEHCRGRAWQIVRGEAPAPARDPKQAELMFPKLWGPRLLAARRHAEGRCACAQLGLEPPARSSAAAAAEDVDEGQGVLEVPLPARIRGVLEDDLPTRWDLVLEELRRHINPQDVRIWFESARPVLAGGALVLELPSVHHQAWIDENYREQLAAALEVVADA